ncbi:MAG: DNA repair protein RecN [Candidatus Coproplasma sp.]
MLSNLYIKNVALIEEGDIQFDKKLNILSGETGSGKSVILDSINFVLGSKADKSMIRYGCGEAVVRAEFSCEDNPIVKNLLQEMDIDCDDDTIIISRRMSVDGKSSIKLNGSSITAGMLKKVASHLVDVHGQSEHFFLLNEANQLSVVDSLCGENLLRLKDSLAEKLHRKKDCINKISLLGGSEQERAQRLDLLTYQIKEIESAEIKDGEIEDLKARKKVLDNAERIMQALGTAKGLLSDDNGCIDLLSTAKRQVSPIADVSDEFSNLSDRLENLFIEAEDIGDTLSDMLDNFTFDAQEANFVEERLTLYRNLIKKYGADEREILCFLEDAKQKYDALNDAADELLKLNGEIEKLDEEILSICVEITKTRKAACESFCGEVVSQLKTLNIPNAQFYVEFSEYDSVDNVTSNGADKICFMFSANKGEPPKPLNKVISGGEMSRFMLAVKTILKGINGITTYIFDEIDAGISGETAKSVAHKFVTISNQTQIIAVSHLPQVCAAASSQFLISKSDVDAKTVTSVRKLNREERVAELVRLTGSISTDAAKAHADELLRQFNN